VEAMEPEQFKKPMAETPARLPEPAYAGGSCARGSPSPAEPERAAPSPAEPTRGGAARSRRERGVATGVSEEATGKYNANPYLHRWQEPKPKQGAALEVTQPASVAAVPRTSATEREISVMISGRGDARRRRSWSAASLLHEPLSLAADEQVAKHEEEEAWGKAYMCGRSWCRSALVCGGLVLGPGSSREVIFVAGYFKILNDCWCCVHIVELPCRRAGAGCWTCRLPTSWFGVSMVAKRLSFSEQCKFCHGNSYVFQYTYPGDDGDEYLIFLREEMNIFLILGLEKRYRHDERSASTSLAGKMIGPLKFHAVLPNLQSRIRIAWKDQNMFRRQGAQGQAVAWQDFLPPQQAVLDDASSETIQVNPVTIYGQYSQG
ncbi:hypothetical protein EJB05_50768, partial [Eragrostis curvula]